MAFSCPNYYSFATKNLYHLTPLSLLIIQSTPKSTILVKIEAERILEPQLTLVNEGFKILKNDEFGQKRLFGVHSLLLVK